MKIDVLSLFPEMFEGFLTTSIIKRAIDSDHVEVTIHDFREFATDRHKSVDDTPYGGGQGMVLMCKPLLDCLKTVVTKDSLVILMSPGYDSSSGLCGRIGFEAEAYCYYLWSL